MGDIMRRVITLFEIQGANQIRASLGTMAGSFGGYRSEINRTGKEMGYLEQQTRAFATTWRYMVAGAGVYGTLSMIRNLGEFQAQLGEISAIATGPGGLPVVGQELDNLGTRLLDVSNKTTQPISDLETGVLSLYSTIGDVPPNKAADMMETISNTAITSQSNIQDTTQALLGMLNAFGAGTDELPRFADEFQKVIQLSAGMPGSVYAQKLGTLSASASLGHFTPEQMGALAIGATRSGGAPATNMQYLAQMMMFLMHPATKEASSTLAGIGLGPQQRQRMGGWGTLMAFLGEVNRQGGVGVSPALAGASEDMLNQIDSSGLTAGQAGITGGGTDLISKAFGRIQSQRMAAVLSRIMTPEQVAGTENKTLAQYLDDVSNSAGSVDQAMERAMDYRRIKQAGNALHNMGIELGTVLSPLINLGARGITPIVSDFNKQNPWAQRGELAGAVVGGLTAARLLRGGLRFGSAVRGVGLVGAGLDAMNTTGMRGDSPLKPLYVAVVYSLAGNGPMGGFSTGRIPNRDLRTAEGEVGSGGLGGPRGAPKPRRFRGVGLGLVGTIASTVGADYLIHSYLQSRGFESDVGDPTVAQARGDPLLRANPLYRYLAEYKGRNVLGDPYFTHGTTGSEKKIIDAFESHKMTMAQAEAALRRVATPEQLRGAGIKGKAEVTVNIDHTDPATGTKKRTSQHVTIDLFPDFTQIAPQQRGKKTRRAG